VGNDSGQQNTIIFLSLDVMGEKRAMFNQQVSKGVFIVSVFAHVDYIYMHFMLCL